MSAAPLVDAAVRNDLLISASRAALLALLVALIALGLGWELWLAPTGARSLALKVLPLAWPLAGIWGWRLASVRALSLLVWLYVAEGALRVATERGVSAQLAWLELLLCALIFAACVLHVRSRTRAALTGRAPRSSTRCGPRSAPRRCWPTVTCQPTSSIGAAVGVARRW